MNPLHKILFLSLALLSACSTFRPVVEQSRYFVLSTIPSTNALPFGVGLRVEVPDYLQSKSIVLRRAGNEIIYSDHYFWAERFETAIQRALAASIATSNVFVGSWRRESVHREVRCRIDRFDIDPAGTVELSGRCVLSGPGGNPTICSSDFKIGRKGPALDIDPSGATRTFSSALHDLADEITQRLRGCN